MFSIVFPYFWESSPNATTHSTYPPPPPKHIPKHAQNLIVVEMFLILSKTSGLICWFWKLLDVLEMSGRLRGRVSSNVRQKRSAGSRVMTKKLEKFTTIKSMIIEVWAYFGGSLGRYLGVVWEVFWSDFWAYFWPRFWPGFWPGFWGEEKP